MVERGEFFSVGDVEVTLLPERPLDILEIGDFLRNNHNPNPIAGNRFTSRQELDEFVSRLHSTGDTFVGISRDCVYSEEWRVQNEGGSYTDTLVIKLPKDDEAKRKITTIIVEEFERDIRVAKERDGVDMDDYQQEELEQAKLRLLNMNEGWLTLWWD